MQKAIRLNWGPIFGDLSHPLSRARRTAVGCSGCGQLVEAIVSCHPQSFSMSTDSTEGNQSKQTIAYSEDTFLFHCWCTEDLTVEIARLSCQKIILTWLVVSTNNLAGGFQWLLHAQMPKKAGSMSWLGLWLGLQTRYVFLGNHLIWKIKEIQNSILSDVEWLSMLMLDSPWSPRPWSKRKLAGKPEFLSVKPLWSPYVDPKMVPNPS